MLSVSQLNIIRYDSRFEYIRCLNEHRPVSQIYWRYNHRNAHALIAQMHKSLAKRNLLRRI